MERLVTDPIQTFFGVKSSVFLAGAVGGAVGAVLMGGVWYRQLMNATIGTASAVYLSPVVISLISKRWAVDHQTEHAIVFVSGLIGMTVCEAILRFVQRVRTQAPKLADKAMDRLK